MAGFQLFDRQVFWLFDWKDLGLFDLQDFLPIWPAEFFAYLTGRIFWLFEWQDFFLICDWQVFLAISLAGSFLFNQQDFLPF